MSQYIIQKTTLQDANAVDIDIDWSTITPLTITTFPWYQAGAKQHTQVKLSYCDDALFIKFIAQDKHSVAKQTKLNHMLICEDSCVEFFFSPSGILGNPYVNLEVNCCGTLHIAYGTDRNNRKFISAELANKISCKSSINKPSDIKNITDNLWAVEIKLPFAVIEQLTGEPLNKQQWFANFYRCGGIVEPQYAVWHKIDVPEPDFHRPEYFAELIFL